MMFAKSYCWPSLLPRRLEQRNSLTLLDAPRSGKNFKSPCPTAAYEKRLKI